MSSVEIRRNLYDDAGTTGYLYIDDDPFIINNKHCRTLERPKNGYHPCILEGTYPLTRDFVGKFKYFRIEDVSIRTNIEIHQGNTIDDITGCVLLGCDFAINDPRFKHKFFLFNSTIACRTLYRRLQGDYHQLTISHSNQCFAEEDFL